MNGTVIRKRYAKLIIIVSCVFILAFRHDTCLAFGGTGITDAMSAASGWVTDAGNTYYYESGTARTGWLVTAISPDGADTGLQRYWLGSSGILAVARLVPTGEAEYSAYACSDGTIARGKCIASDGSMYLAGNDGRLLLPGWHVTAAFDGGLQRYYIDSSYKVMTGKFTVDGASYYAAPENGYELRGAASVNGDFYYADNAGKLFQNGFLVTAAYGQELQRYWFADGKAAPEGVYITDADGSEAYVRPEGYVVRGKYRSSSGITYLSDNDGNLEKPGWLVTAAYDGGLQRYYIDPASHGAPAGFFTVGNDEFYDVPGQGYVMRGKYRYDTDGMLLADNEGSLAKFTNNGWLVTGLYDGGLERYRIDDCCGGHAGAHTGPFYIGGNLYYGSESQGYELRNLTLYYNGNFYHSDNEGLMTLSTRLSAVEIGNIAASYCLEKVGSAYSQDSRWAPDTYDCSSLAYRAYSETSGRTGFDINALTGCSGLDLPDDICYSAANEASWIEQNGAAVSESQLAPGDLIFYGGSSNGRYRGIYHVAVYTGSGMQVAATGPSVVLQSFKPSNIGLYGRPALIQ